MPATSQSAWIEAWERDLIPSAAARRSAARSAARVRSTHYYGREATARLPQPLPEAERWESPPQLKVVKKRERHWGMTLLVLLFVAIVLGSGIVAPVMINSAATATEARVGQLESQQKELLAATSALAAQISAMSSPERIAEEATRLGLEPASSVHYMAAGAASVAMEGDTTVAGR